MKEPFLLEIGLEEVPARFLPGIRIQMKERMERFLDDLAVDHGEPVAYATPRRLAVVVPDVAVRQKDRRTEVTGPPVKAAFDSAGNPTKAAEGFARSQGVNVEDLVRCRTDRGEYVTALVEQTGRETAEVLGEGLPDWIRALSFPKSMRWGGGSLRFARPIHWITALFGGAALPFELEGIQSGNATRGHRFLSPGAFQVKSPASYEKLLERNYVVVDHDERKRRIADGAAELAKRVGGTLIEDPELLAHVSDLVEHPHPILGKFDDQFLDLPRELPITVMRDHQKYFAVEDDAGHLMPFFITVSNGLGDHEDVIREGNERVLRARLDDARFYFAEDGKRTLDERVGDLKAVTYQEKLGTVYDKVERIVELAGTLAEVLAPDTLAHVQRAAWLAKADLTTGVVYEFPELQGYMGQVYAKNDGEDAEVVRAVGEHYRPRFSGDEVPGTDTGAIVSLADKIDSIVGFFSVGLTPTGSEDPFALRRQTLGIVAVLDQRQYGLDIGDLVGMAVDVYQRRGFAIAEGLKESVLEFFRGRVQVVLEGEGHAQDSVEAVLSAGAGSLVDIRRRLAALAALRSDDRFPGFLTAARRAANILGKYEGTPLREDRLDGAAERGLYSALQRARSTVSVDDPFGCFELSAPIDKFFEDVLVMDKERDVRENRLALLKNVTDVFAAIADFSKISE